MRGATRDRLLERGARELRASGTRAFSLRKVAAAAGVSPMAAYRHFADKEALLAALAAAALRRFAAALRAAARRPRSARRQLIDACVAYVGFARQHPAEFDLMFGTAIDDRKRHPDLWAAGGEAFEVLLGIVDACQRAGVIRETLDRVECAAELWVHIHGLSALSPHWPTSGRIRTPASAQRMVARFMGHLLGGLGGQER